MLTPDAPAVAHPCAAVGSGDRYRALATGADSAMYGRRELG
ncbi:hypothetical protein [Streptomyces sp. NPDC102409]